MEDRPLDIRRFETLQFAAAFVGLVHGFAIGFGIFRSVLGAAVAIALTLLVSRYRKNWARWTLLFLFVIGVAGLVVGLFFGITQKATSTVYPALTVLAWALSALAVVLLFTPKSDAWLRLTGAKD
jgi:cytochrome c oxidase subunit IV